jgi:Flp pilus assembly CpaF family ATPase
MVMDDGQEQRLQILGTEMRPILPFLEDSRVHDILLNADGTIWIDRAGAGLSRTDATMKRQQADSMLRTIAAATGKQLGPLNPSLAANLPRWNLRVQGLVPPIVRAPIFALRKPAPLVFPLEHYEERKILPELLPDQPGRTEETGWAAQWREELAKHDRPLSVLQKLRLAVRRRANILIGGGTATGKTTFANTILNELSDTSDRILIVEDTPELRCGAANQVTLTVNEGSYSWQDAVMDAMRLRPDRIVMGEVRDRAAHDLIKAWNTGHPGGLATLHANDASSMLERICQLCEEGLQGAAAPRRFIAEAINVLVHLRRDPSHPAGRRVSEVALVEGLGANGAWKLSSL